MSHIVIDARMLSWTGIGRYTTRLLENLQDIDRENLYTVLLSPKDVDKWTPHSTNFTKQVADFSPYSLAGLLKFSSFLSSLKPDLVHFTSQNTPLFYTGRHISTVHDLTLLDYKNIRGSQVNYEVKYQIFRLMISRTIRKSQLLLTPTNYVKKQLIDRYGTPSNKIFVTPEAADKLSAKPVSINRFKINGPYILHVGNAYPHKNLTALLEAMADVQKIHSNIKLVLVGREDYFVNNLKQKTSNLNLENMIIFTGFATDNELATLYENATLFVLPSLSEGFGLPGLEAMAANVPVVAARASCLPEVYGDAAAYFNPLDPKDISQTIVSTLSDKQKLVTMKKAGQARIKKFSWRRMAKQTHKAYLAALTDEFI